jgi:hypothetical protein
MNTLLFSLEPEESCIIASDQTGEDELQRIRDKFPRHKIIVCCANHAPVFGVFLAPIKALSNKPPCAIVLDPCDDWKIPEK